MGKNWREDPETQKQHKQVLERLQNGEREMRVRTYVTNDITVEDVHGGWQVFWGDGDVRSGVVDSLEETAWVIVLDGWDPDTLPF